MIGFVLPVTDHNCFACGIDCFACGIDCNCFACVTDCNCFACGAGECHRDIS